MSEAKELRCLPDPHSVRRILVTRLRYLGDVVLSTPLLAALREACPDASIEYLSFAGYAEVLQHHPCVDVVHSLPQGAGLGQTLGLAKELRRPRVDWWIDLFGNPRSALLCLLARPRISVGTDRGLRGRVFDHRMGSAEDDPSAVAHHLHKLQPLLGEVAARTVSIRVSAEEREDARKAFGLDPQRLPILLHPGSTWPSKAWPEEKWSRLIEQLAADGHAVPWVVSGPGDEELAGRIVAASSAPARVLEAQPLRRLLALIQQVAAYIGNDGGILHCAVALGTPTIGIFGPTEPEIWFPHSQDGHVRLAQEYVACRPCHLHHCDHRSCLTGLPVSRVRELLEAVLVARRAGDADA